MAGEPDAEFARDVDASWATFSSGLDAIGTLSRAERIEVIRLAGVLVGAHLDASQRHLTGALREGGVL